MGVYHKLIHPCAGISHDITAVFCRKGPLVAATLFHLLQVYCPLKAPFSITLALCDYHEAIDQKASASIAQALFLKSQPNLLSFPPQPAFGSSVDFESKHKSVIRYKTTFLKFPNLDSCIWIFNSLIFRFCRYIKAKR